MNLYIVSAIAIFVLFIPVSFVSADDLIETQFVNDVNSEGADDGRIYVFVQIVQRNSNGDLVTFLQSDKMTYINANTMNYYVDERAKVMDIPVYDFEGTLVQAYGEKFTVTLTKKDLTASTLLVVEKINEENPDESERSVAARFAHDGFVNEPGDVVATTWYIARLLN